MFVNLHHWLDWGLKRSYDSRPGDSTRPLNSSDIPLISHQLHSAFRYRKNCSLIKGETVVCRSPSLHVNQSGLQFLPLILPNREHAWWIHGRSEAKIPRPRSKQRDCMNHTVVLLQCLHVLIKTTNSLNNKSTVRRKEKKIKLRMTEINRMIDFSLSHLQTQNGRRPYSSSGDNSVAPHHGVSQLQFRFSYPRNYSSTEE